MEAGLFVRAVGFGLVAAAALGPIGLLVIRRTLARGRAYGLASGVGVAAADATYAALAAFGLTALTDALVGADRVLGAVGGVVLLGLGARAVATARPAEARADRIVRSGLVAAALSILALTLANPMTILTFVALFASLGAAASGVAGAAAVTLGVFAGSLAWWAALTGAVGALRSRLTPRVVRGLNLISGGAIGAFGLAALLASVAG